jgi:hypothetical protein
MKRKMAKSAPKKDPKNDFIGLNIAMFFDHPESIGSTGKQNTGWKPMLH